MNALKSSKGYGLAIALSVIAVPLALRFDTPSSSFLLAAMATSLFAGRKPGLLSAALCTLSFDFFFLAPKHHLLLSEGTWPRFLSFVVAMLLATEMIDAKRRSDKARLQREKDFRSLAQTSPDCILIIDEQQLIQFANPSVANLFGYTVQEAMGHPVNIILPELTKEQSPHGEFLASKKGGGHLEVEATCGRFGEKTTIFLRDITERKMAQRALEQSKENLKLTLDTIPGMVYSRSADGKLEYVNRMETEYYGVEQDALANGAWIEALHPDERDAVLAEIDAHFAKGEMYTMTYRRRRFDGVYRWFQTSARPFKDANGRIIRWYGLLTDIDDRRRMEDSLRQTESRLAQATQMATAAELSASIVHEISQPIAAMVANGQACIRWLSANPPNLANSMTAVERIVRDGKDAREIIKGLRALFKHSAPQMAQLELRQIIDEVTMLSRGRMVRHSVSLELEIPADLPAIKGDRVQLQQVLLNLVSNAIDAMYGNGDRPQKLRIRSEVIDGAVRTQVIDSGTGLTDPAKVFEVFFTTKENGMGMGLAICKSIIEAHNGRLWAENGDPVGAIMSFTVPCFNPQESTELKQPA